MFIKKEQLVLLFLFTCLTNVWKTVTGLDEIEYNAFIHDAIKNPVLVEDYNKSMENLLEIEPHYYDYSPFKYGSMSFHCPLLPPSPQEVTSVHKLRPSDIKVVAALGDSITAGFGLQATKISELAIENRGYSWSIGGKSELETVITMPNILKKYNPKLYGASTSKNILWLPLDSDNLNLARSNDESSDIPGQAKKLVERIRKNKKVNFEKDWKLVTLFIGGNDLCRFCWNLNSRSPKSYVTFIQEGLDYLHDHLPRTFVNLVTVLKISQVQQLSKGLFCAAFHKVACPCAFSNGKWDVPLKMYNNEYIDLTNALVNSSRYDGKDDFTVVVQPFMENMIIPTFPNGQVDFSYLAPDCFHFSAKGHSVAAINLWNAMFKPVGQKSTQMNFTPQIVCPDNDKPFLFTSKNSF